MGRRKPAAAFSLFSFQDIVTSVTAILILVMLLLSVELVSRRRSESAANPAATRQNLMTTIERLETLAQALRDDVAARRSRSPARTPADAERHLARVLRELEASRRHLAESIGTRDAAARLRTEAEARAASRRSDAEEIVRLERQAAEDAELTDRLEESNTKERERQEKRNREIADDSRAGTELVFNAPADANRRAWLVELSRDGINVVLLGGGRTEKFGGDTGATGAFFRWSAGLSPEGDYCLLLQRPSAADSLLEAVQTRLRDRGIRFGIDLIGEEQAVRDASRPGSGSP